MTLKEYLKEWDWKDDYYRLSPEDRHAHDEEVKKLKNETPEERRSKFHSFHHNISQASKQDLDQLKSSSKTKHLIGTIRFYEAAKTPKGAEVIYEPYLFLPIDKEFRVYYKDDDSNRNETLQKFRNQAVEVIGHFDKENWFNISSIKPWDKYKGKSEEYGDEREQHLISKNKKIEACKHTLDGLLNAFPSPEKMPGAMKKFFYDTLRELKDVDPEEAKKYKVK